MVVLEVHLKKLGDQSPPSLSLSALASLCICGGGADSAVGERYTNINTAHGVPSGSSNGFILYTI